MMAFYTTSSILILLFSVESGLFSAFELNIKPSDFLQAWRFCLNFADILGLWPFTLDEFLQAFHDYVSTFG